MNHNDATDEDLAKDPDPTEVGSVRDFDAEQRLHDELDAQRARTVSAMRAARPLLGPPPPRGPSSHFETAPPGRLTPARLTPALRPSDARIPPMPIHTLPATEDEGDDPTCVFDRSSTRASVPHASTPSMRSVSFPAPTFTAPRKPQPFATIPAMPSAKRAAAVTGSQSVSIVPVPAPRELRPTTRHELSLANVNPNDSVPPVSMPSSYPSDRVSAPRPSGRASVVAAALTASIAFAAVAAMAVAMFQPALLDRGRDALTSAFTRHAPIASAGGAAAAANEPAAVIAVPPVLIDDDPDVAIGDLQTYLVFPESAKGHRVFVDGHAIGDGDAPALVDCGKHKIQLGSNGKERVLDLACGGGYRLTD